MNDWPVDWQTVRDLAIIAAFCGFVLFLVFGVNRRPPDDDLPSWWNGW